ncbi:MAG: surface carbohydrate biosynthesis protein [Candidatus Competibacterales bacterium]
MATPHPPTVVLPVEIKNRELDANVLLAAALAERGWRALVISYWQLGAVGHRLPPALWVMKNVTRRSLDLFARLRAWGHTLWALDEEALVIYSEAVYRRRRLALETMGQARGLLAWGEANTHLWRNYLAEAGGGEIPIYAVGNPRLDLTRPALRTVYHPAVAALKGRFGPYVLINSNFGTVNPKAAALLRLPRPEDVAAGRVAAPPHYDPELAHHRHRAFQAFLQAFPTLARRVPQLQFVLRPHPAEGGKPWEAAAQGLANAHVVYEGEAVPWILGATAVVHHSCTTAVEAFFCDRPVFSYHPSPDAAYQPPITRALSQETATLAELCDGLAAAAAGQPSSPGDSVRWQTATHFVASARGSLACDRIGQQLSPDLEVFAPQPPLTTGQRLWGRRQWHPHEARHRQP